MFNTYATGFRQVSALDEACQPSTHPYCGNWLVSAAVCEQAR